MQLSQHKGGEAGKEILRLGVWRPFFPQASFPSHDTPGLVKSAKRTPPVTVAVSGPTHSGRSDSQWPSHKDLMPGLGTQGLAALLQRMQPMGHPKDIKRDEVVGHEVIIFDDLALLSRRELSLPHRRTSIWQAR